MDRLLERGKLSIPLLNGAIEIVDLASIQCFNSNGPTTIVSLDNRELTSRENLLYFQETLQGLFFGRVHNQCIVNLDKIEHCTKENVLVLKSGMKVEMSRRKAEAILSLLKACVAAEQKTITGIAFLFVDYKLADSTIEVIQPGTQIVGRKSKKDTADISIDNGDPSLSRKHFIIEAEKSPKGKYQFFVTPHDAEKIVLVGSKALKPTDKHEIEAGSVIRAGQTSFLFKTSLHDPE